MDRRNAIRTMILCATAPAIVKLESIMPVKSIVVPEYADIWDVFSDDGSVSLRKSPILPMPIHTPLYDIISETSEDMDAIRLQLYFSRVYLSYGRR